MTRNELGAIVLMAELVGMLALGSAWAWLRVLWASRGAPLPFERFKWPLVLTTATLALLGGSLLLFAVRAIVRIEG